MNLDVSGRQPPRLASAIMLAAAFSCGSDQTTSAPADLPVAGQAMSPTSAAASAPVTASSAQSSPVPATPAIPAVSSMAAAPAAMAAPPAPAAPTTPAKAAPEDHAPEDSAWCGALSVFRTSCQTCHGVELEGGAPMPLVTFADTQAPAPSDPSRSVWELIGERVHDSARPMPPLSQAPLSAADVTALDRWLEAGALSAEAECQGIAEPMGTVEPEPEWPSDCEERYEIRAHSNGGPYVVPAEAEENINIEVPVPWQAAEGEAIQALAIRPIKGNKRVVHHWILYAGAFDFITSWSPGKPFEVFPEDVGVHMPSTGTFRLNMHYYNVGNPEPEPDQSGLEVCITRHPRKNTATTYMFAGSASVPARSHVDNVGTCEVNASEPVHLITSSPHMHSYGVASKLEIVRPDGSVEVLEDGPFNWEDQHVTKVDAVIQTGDKVRITCSYVNNSDRAISFGESSQDEMCFNFSRYYPKGALSCGSGGPGFF